MARQSRSRLNFGRVFSPRSKCAAAVASVQAQEKRRKTRVKRWRERFKRFSLSAWHESAIVQTVCGLFRSSAATARALRAASSSQIVGLGVGNRSLRMEGLEARQMLNATYHDLSSSNFAQDWTNTALISTNDDWSGVPSIIGYRGDDITSGTGVDPQTLLGDGTVTIDVNANQTNPNTFSTGGVSEFEITNPVVALQGSGTADAPNLVFHLDTIGRQDITFDYNLRDIDGSTDDAIQAVALQFRVGNSGTWTNVAAGFVADATTGPSLATLVTPVHATLPAAANNQPQIQIRVITSNAAGNDEWVGVDDIAISSIAATTVYVDDAWIGFSSGQIITDADGSTAGDQAGKFGVNAFDTIQAALAAVGSNGTVIVNAGTYSGSSLVDNGKTVKIVGAADTGLGDFTVSGGTLTVDAPLMTSGLGVNSGGLLNGSSSVTVPMVFINAGGTLNMPSGGSVDGNVLLNHATAMLKGKGTITGSVTGSGIIEPGFSPGVLNIGVNLITSGALNLEVNSPYAPADFDQIVVGGGVNLNGATITFTGTGAAPTSTTHLTIIDSGNGGTTSRTGTNLQEGASVIINGATFTLSYNDAAGPEVGDLTLSYTPPNAVSTFSFADSWAKIIIDDLIPSGGPLANPEMILVQGPSQVRVDWEGPSPGDANDNGGAPGRDEIQTEMLQLDLVGVAPITLGGGPLQIQLVGPPSVGGMEEQVQGTPGQLDFAVDSFFDVFFEVQIGSNVFHNNQPLKLQGTQGAAQAAPGETFMFNGPPVMLFDALNQPTGIFVTQVMQTPQPVYDFGDAPDPLYPTLLANNGPRHVVMGPRLGATVEPDPDGQPDADALGDDVTDGTDDEDGVAFSGTLFSSNSTTNPGSVDVDSTGGLLDAWIDFNADGVFGAGEQIAASMPLAPGVTPVGFTIPVGAAVGDTFARFRISSTGGLAPTGLALDGEVEDHKLTIVHLNTPAVIGGDTTGAVTEDSGAGQMDSGTLTISDDDGVSEEMFQPAAGATTYGSYTLAANGDWVYTLDNANVAVQALNNGDTLPDSFIAVSADGTAQQVDITINGADEGSPIVTVTGTDGDNDKLVIDMSTPPGTYQHYVNNIPVGAPSSLAGVTDLHFIGGAGANDVVEILDADGGTHTYDYTNASDGTIEIGTLTIHYTGLEPILNTGTAAEVEFNLPAGTDNATLSDIGGGMWRLSASTFEDTDFAIPTDKLTINGGADDTLLVTVDVSVSTSIALNVGTVTLDANLTATTITGTADIVNVQSNMAQIGDAIAIANVGATINVAAGTFSENIVLNKQVTLKGAQAGVDARGRVAAETILAPLVVSTRILELTGAVAGSIIDGLTFSGGTATLGQLESTGGINNLQILNNRFVGFTGRAVNLNDTGVDITVDKNVFDGASNTSAVSGVFHLDTDTFNGFYFTNNSVLNAPNTEGFFVDGNRNVGTSAMRSSLISGNKFNNNNVGMNVGSRALDGVTVSLNEFKDNNFDGLQGGPKDSLITQNTFSGNDRWGLALTSFGNMTAGRGAINTVVSGNFFSNNTGMVSSGDILVSSTMPVGNAATNTITGNSLTSPVALSYSGTETVNASGNWWGTASNPEFASRFAGTGAANIDYSPWLELATDVGGNASDGFQGDYSVVIVSADSPEATVGGRINEGIAATTSGGTVKIFGGTYVENVDASSKVVTLSPGASPGQVSITGNLTLTSDDVLAIEINGLNPATQFDNFLVSGTATLGSAALAVSGTYFPSVGNTFTIIDAAALSGALSTTTAVLNGFPLSVTYPGGGDVVLEVPQPTTVWVDDDWTITTDIGAPGLSAGDTVESGLGETVVSGLTFGYDAFATIVNAITAVATSGTINVLAGTYVQTLAPVAIDIAKSVTIAGQGEADVTINANGSSTGIRVQAGNTVGISGIAMSNYSTGVRVQGTLMLSDSALSGGFVGVWVDGGMLDMDSTAVTGVQIFGVQVGGGTADIDDSEISGIATAAASVVVSAGTAAIDGSILTGSQRGLLVNAAGSAAIHGSSVAGTGLRGVENATATPVDASGNWWGTSASDAAVQALTLGQVDFTPYLHNNESVPNQSVRGFTADNSYLHVTTLGSQVGGGGRIAEALGYLADGSLVGGNRIIDVAAGTYAENLLVNKSVYLKGANDGTAGSGVRGAESVIRADGNTSGVVTVTANDITISGFTVSGDDPGTVGLPVHSGLDANALYAITNGDTVSGAPIDGLTVRDNIIQQTALGVHGNGISGASTTSVIDANLFQDIGVYDFGYAISLRNNFYADITNNVMRRVYTGVLVNNFSSSKGSPWLMQGNDIESYAAGLWHNQSYGASTSMTIDGNMFKQSAGPAVADNIGILFTLGPGGNLPTVTNNTIDDHDYGMVVWGTPGGLTLASSNSISGADTGIYVTNNVGFNPIGSTVLGLVATPSSVVVDGMTIDASVTGISVRGDAGGGISSVTVQNDTDISGAATGILVSGPNATAMISGNDASIHGNTIGIDVNAGTATISNNHIYDNTTGIRFTNGGAGNVDDNNFEGGADPDNGTDLRLDSDAGGIIGGTLTGNTFAGTTYIDQQDSQNLTALRDPFGTNFYNVAGVATTNDFTIESRIFHKIDNAASGLVTWVPNLILVASVAETGSTPTATDNDYTRIKNAIEAAGNGDTIKLLGGGANAFNWTETFAAASWALGNDGLLDGVYVDDYSITVPATLSGVTLTAASGLGSATIQGPGDLATYDLEGFLQFYAPGNGSANNQNWTISDLEIFDFDLAIGAFSSGTPTTQMSGLTITNNHIRLPADWNDVDNPDDASQNIAIHLAFGANQTITNNVIDLDGGGDSGAGVAAEVALQSNTSGGSVYNGLLIDGNIINVLNAQSANPELIRGIWENSNGTTANITVSNNQFHNLAGLNDPALNAQIAYRLTSPSSGSSTVTWSGNSVDGAHVGFAYYPGYNNSGTAPVEILNNTLTNVFTGFDFANSTTVNHLSGNSLTGTGAGVGVDIGAGTVVTIDDAVAENEISGFATGIQSAGTLIVNGNNASIHGNVTGIDVTGGTATITGNHIYDNTTGIRFTTGGSGSVAGNNFDDATDNTTDLLLTATAGAVTAVTTNSFAGDTFFIDNQSTQNIDATTDTFDEASNFRIEDKMHHRVDTDLAVSNGLVTWVAGNLYITDPAISPVSTDSDIQRGIDAASAGNTINVEAGTYTHTSQILVNKNLTIIGAGKTSTFFTKNFDTGGSGDARGWWLVDAGVSLDLSDVAFDGTGNLTWQAIRHKGSGTIDNVAFTEIKYNESGPNYAGTAVAFFPAAGGNLDVTNSMFSEIGRQGVLFFGTGVTGTFESNMYTGKGAGDWLDYAVEVGAGAKVDIIGNTISGNLGVASVDSSTSAGVLVTTFFGPGSEAHFSGANVISGNTTGVAIGFDGTDSSVVTATGGQFKDNDASGFSIIGGGSAMLTVTGATVTGNDATGISADGANVKVETTDLTGNDVGIRVENDAVVDAGGGSFGSTGGNILTGYTGTGGNYAIEDLNFAPGPDVYAKFNDFGPYVNISIIENYVFDDTDDPTRTMVIFTGALNQQAAPAVVFVDDDWAGTSLGTDADGAGNIVANWTGIGGNANGTAFGVDQFATIQDAINAVAPGGSIYVYDGTYVEELLVSQALSMFGFQAGQDARTRGVVNESVIQASTVGGALIEVSAAGVTIDGFTVDGDDLATRAIRVNEVDNAVVRNNIITAAERGVQYNGSASGNTGGLVERNLIQNLSTSGTSYGVLAFDASYASVMNNEMTGLDVGIFEQYFYQPNGGGNPNNVISGNDIEAALLGYGTNERSSAAATTALSGNVYTIGAGGVGIQLYNIYKSGGITLTNETITGAHLGVYAYVNGGSVSITGSSISGDGAPGSIGVQVTNYLSYYPSYATSFSSVPSALTISGSDISGFKTGVFVEDADADFDLDTIDDATGTVTATITSDTDISGADTGVLVSGPAAAAIITGNGGSIHGNTVGIDVDGGSATVTGNHIFDNGTGVWFHNGGAGSVASNDFNDDTLGDTDDDNDTDILIAASAGTVTIGDGNDYAGDDYYIENLSTQTFDLTSHGAATYEGSTPGSLPDDFRIEDHMFHGPDNGTSGVVYWVAGELFVSAPSTHINDETIQNAVDVANAGETVNVEAGTFSENLLIGKDIKIIGDAAGGTTLTSAVANSKLITVLGAGVFGTADDLVQISNLNLDGASLAAYGVYVEGTADLGTLTVDSAVPASVSNFKINGVYVDAAAYLSGDPSVSAMVQQVNLTNLSFANNGISGGGGMGDVNFFGFNNNASLTDLVLVGSRNEGGGTGARLAIQLRGTGDAAGVGSAAMGNVQFVNVDVSGKYRNQMIGIQRYTDVSSLSFSGVELGGATSEITGGFGASLRFDAVGNGSVSSPATVDLGDTTFRGLAGSSAQPHEIEFAPDNLHTFLRADGTNTTWVIGGTPFAASALTLTQAFAVEDRILHYVDKLNPTHALTFGPYKGFVDIQAGKAFITDQADSGLIGDGSITRGARVVTLGGTVHVEDGTYFEDVVVDRGVTVLGDNLPTIHAVDDNDNSSVVIEVRADNVTIQGLDVVVNRDDASGGIAASNVAQADVNMTGGSFNNLMILDNVITPVGENNVGSFFLHTGLPATTMGIALIGMGGPAHSVTIQGNQILADLGSAPITGGPLAASIFTRGIYLGELQATVGGSGVGEGNTSTGLAQDLLVQFASNGTTTIEGNTFLIAGVDISSPNANAPVNIIDNLFAPPDLVSVPGFPLQSLLIRNFSNHVTSPITIDGNTFDDFNLGIDVEAGSATITGNTLVNVDDGGGDTIGAAAIGIRVRAGASAVISDDNDITGTSTGILVLGSATIVDNDNSINGNGIGIDVDGGTALVQNNDLNGNTIGVRIQNGGIADLGQTSGSAVNFTGLSGGTGPNGSSAGGNDFSSYTVAATSTSGAIVNLNTNGLNANPGRQGAPPDVTAFGNTWNTPTANGIENVVWHDSDNSALGFVDFAAFGNLVVTPTSPTTINEGGMVSIDGSFTNVPQAHTITIVWGDGSPNTVINNVSGDFDFSSSHTYVDDVDGPPTSSMHQITVTVQDASLATIGPSAPIDVTVNDVTPTVVFGVAPTSANDGDVKHYTFTTSDPGDDNWTPGELGPPTITVMTLSGGATGVVSNVIFDPVTGNGSFDVTFSVPPGGGTAEVKVQVPDDDGLVGETSVVVGVSNTLHVTAISINDSGFDLTFNRAIELADLNLYDYVNPLIIGDMFKLPDMIVHASTANIDLKGSVVWDAATNKLSWVKTGGPLGSDNYLLTLKSGSTAFRDTFGNLLDGNNDGTPGDDYVQAFNVNVIGGTPVVSLPDFARGPGQGVDLTANNTLDTTLPVRATGVNVQGVDFKLVYDTTLLTINPAQVTAVLPMWSVVVNQTVLGNIATLTVAAFTSNPGAAFTGTTNVVNIIATVPSSAPYGASQVLRLTNSLVNEINAQNDFAIQKVAFPGDANGSGILPLSAPPSAYTAEDASLIAQVVVGSNGSTGFDGYPLVDPAIVGDASGNGSLSAFDASLIAQEAAGINTPETPDETAPGSGGSAMYDPELSVPDNIPVATGHTYQIPVNITIEPTVVGIISTTYTVQYDTTKLDYLSTTNGDDFPSGSGWILNSSEPTPGTIQVSMFNTSPSTNNGGLPQQLSKITFFVLNAAGLGSSNLVINPVDPNETGLIWTKDDGSVNINRLLGDYNFDGVVDSGDYVVWRNMVGMTVPAYTGADGNGDTMIDAADYAIWRAHFGETFPGAGSGSGSGTSAGSNLSSGEPIIESSSVAAAAATSAGGSVEFVETSQVSMADTTVAPAVLVERQAARDEALVGLVESLSASRTFTRIPSARVTKFDTAKIDSLNQNTSDLLFDLAAEEKPIREAFDDEPYRPATHDDSDIDALDELFAELEDASAEIGAGV